MPSVRRQKRPNEPDESSVDDCSFGNGGEDERASFSSKGAGVGDCEDLQQFSLSSWTSIPRTKIL